MVNHERQLFNSTLNQSSNAVYVIMSRIVLSSILLYKEEGFLCLSAITEKSTDPIVNKILHNFVGITESAQPYIEP